MLAIDNLGAGAASAVVVTNDGAGAESWSEPKNSPVRWMVMGLRSMNDGNWRMLAMTDCLARRVAAESCVAPERPRELCCRRTVVTPLAVDELRQRRRLRQERRRAADDCRGATPQDRTLTLVQLSQALSARNWRLRVADGRLPWARRWRMLARAIAGGVCSATIQGWSAASPTRSPGYELSRSPRSPRRRGRC